MPSIIFYFHVHQPFRIKDYTLFEIGDDSQYFDNPQLKRLDNQIVLKKVAEKCYLPTNQAIYEIIQAHPDFKVSYSISGVALEQFQRYAPEVLQSFQRLVATGNVELVNETYYHSLASIKSDQEFFKQVELHRQILQALFDYTPTSFRNTELIYNNDIAAKVAQLGFKAILAEGVDRYLGWRSPNFLYRPTGSPNLKLLLKNYKLSDDIAFRFSNRGWEEWPLTAEKYSQWLSALNGNGEVVNLFMDYETFGEHQWADTGIFDFLRQLPWELKKHPDNNFLTVSEAADKYSARDEVDMPQLTSWADLERDLSAWLSNPMQVNALETVFAMEPEVLASSDEQLKHDWRRLTTSDHFYYMCTKWFSDGDVHKYFSPNETPFEAYRHYMTVLHDLRLRLRQLQNPTKSDSALANPNRGVVD